MKIFISSTYRDLKQIRESIQRSLNKAESFYSRGMEFFSASNDSPSDTCLTEIQKADLIILIISDNYGSIVPGSNLSYTHLEFREAVKYKKPILAFLYENPSDPFVQTFQNEVLGLNKVVDQFCNEHELLGKIWPALFDYLYENGIIVQDSTFQKFGDFYSKYLNQNAVFNLCQPFIGRKDIITQLISFISGPQKICIILGVGGIGKTKLLYEFSNNFKDDKYELRFLSPYKNFSQQSILELPQKPTCVVIEDAHRRSDLNAIFETVLSNNNYKIILTSRQSGLATLHKLTSLFQEDDILRINLDNLGKTDAIVLAEEVLGDNFKQYAKTLVRQSSGSTLVICIGGKLIRDGKVSSTLIDNEDFKYNAVENLLEEAYLHHEPLKTNIKKLLEILAGINPFSVNSSLDVIAKEIGLEKYQVSQLIRHLKTIGLLIERGEKLRIAPDVFADNLIFNASCSTGQYSSDFIDYLITNFGDEYFLNILKNAAELEFSLNINRNKLTENAWEIFFKKFENVSFDKLINLCEQLKEVSYFAPDKALKIINFVIENFENDLADGRLIDRISAILQEIGIHPEFTKTICHILWRLCKEETKGTSENSGAYIFNVFKKLASLDNGNTCEAVEGALDAVKEILESNKLNKTHCLLFEVLNSSLSAELEFNSYNARQFSISWVSPFNQPTEVLNKIKKIRYKAINLINLFVKTSDKNVIKSTIDFLLLHISWPYMHGNRTSNFENELNKEGIEFLKIFKEIIAKNNNDFLIAYIRTKLEAKNSIIDSVKQKLDDNYLNIPKKTHEELLFFCLLNEWAPHICLNIEDDNKLFQKQQEDTAKWFWQKCDNDPAKLITELTNHLEQLNNWGIVNTASTFQKYCAKTNDCKVPDIINLLIKNPEKHYNFRIQNWLPWCPKENIFEVSNEIINHGSELQKKDFAWTFGMFSKLFNSKAQCLEMIRKVYNLPLEISSCIIDNLGFLYNDLGKPQEIIDLICNYDVGNSGKLLEDLLQNFHTTYGVDIRQLSPEQTEQIIKKIERIDEFNREYWIINTLNILAEINLQKVIDCLLGRIKASIGKREDGNYRPFPYISSSSPKEVVLNSPDYIICLKKILDFSIKNQQWQSFFWCPKLVVWLDPKFTQTTKHLLLSLLDDNNIIIITDIFAEYEREIFFDNNEFAEKLLEKSHRLPEKVRDKVFSKISFLPFSGMQDVSGLGEHDTLATKVITLCEEKLKDTSLKQYLKEFYINLKKFAEGEDKRKLERDKLELEEEEWG